MRVRTSASQSSSLYIVYFRDHWLSKRCRERYWRYCSCAELLYGECFQRSRGQCSLRYQRCGLGCWTLIYYLWTINKRRFSGVFRRQACNEHCWKNECRHNLGESTIIQSNKLVHGSNSSESNQEGGLRWFVYQTIRH